MCATCAAVARVAVCSDHCPLTHPGCSKSLSVVLWSGHPFANQQLWLAAFEGLILAFQKAVIVRSGPFGWAGADAWSTEH
jgi:hypothetical protein